MDAIIFSIKLGICVVFMCISIDFNAFGFNISSPPRSPPPNWSIKLRVCNMQKKKRKKLLKNRKNSQWSKQVLLCIPLHVLFFYFLIKCTTKVNCGIPTHTHTHTIEEPSIPRAITWSAFVPANIVLTALTHQLSKQALHNPQRTKTDHLIMRNVPNYQKAIQQLSLRRDSTNCQAFTPFSFGSFNSNRMPTKYLCGFCKKKKK